MNFAYLHLILNHIPMIGLPVALVFLLYGMYVKNVPSQRFALMIMVVLAAMVVPVYLTGEPAEEVVEHLPGVVESFIESHEEAAELSLVLTLVAGFAAFAALWFQNDAERRRWLNRGVLGCAIVAIASLVYTANLGGKIRHVEFNPSAHNQTENKMEAVKDTDND
jgi:NO-binding membrane sensor protein with MHYT domain